MNDGGQAFPNNDSTDTDRKGDRYIDASEGMTLLDYFAGQALAGVVAADCMTMHQSVGWSYECAKKMLEKRDQIMEGGKS